MPLLMFYENAGGLDYLKRCGVAAPEQAPVHGRYQSPSEVRMAVGRLQGCRAEFTVGPTTFDVLIDRDDGAWTFLCFLKYRDADDEARDFYFQTGDPRLTRALLRLLAEECGSFVLLVNNEEPEIVPPPPTPEGEE